MKPTKNSLTTFRKGKGHVIKGGLYLQRYNFLTKTINKIAAEWVESLSPLAAAAVKIDGGSGRQLPVTLVK